MAMLFLIAPLSSAARFRVVYVLSDSLRVRVLCYVLTGTNHLPIPVEAWLVYADNKTSRTGLGYEHGALSSQHPSCAEPCLLNPFPANGAAPAYWKGPRCVHESVQSLQTMKIASSFRWALWCAGKVSIRVECEPDAFNDVLIYMYSGRLSIRPEHAVELLGVSLHYEMEALARVYTSFLEQVQV